MTTRSGCHALAVSANEASRVAPPVAHVLDRLGLRAEQIAGGSGLFAWSDGDAATAVDMVDLVKDQTIDPTAATSQPSSRGEFAQRLGLLLAPAGCLQRDPSTAAISAGVDVRGLAELFYCQGDGWSLLSTSPTLLAAAIDAELDIEAIAVYATIGHFVADATPWLGVRRFGPGEVQQLRAGVSETTIVRPPATTTTSLASAVATVVAEMPANTGEVELSGGLDSRLMVAASRSAGRLPDIGFTIGAQDSSDLHIARDIAQLVGFEHRTAQLEDFSAHSPSALRSIALAGAADRGWVANPVDSAVLHWAESLRTNSPTLSGQNGEIARGFYYRGPHRFERKGRRLPALLRWRLATNDRVSTSLLAMNEDTRHRVVSAALQPLVPDTGTANDFLRATDTFYVEHRMTRWVGPAYGSAGRTHGVVAPFFSAGWIANAAKLDVGDRRMSLSVAQAVVELDPELADIALAGGPAPREMVSPWNSRRHEIVTVGQKSINKVLQRVRRSTGAPAGTPSVVAALLERRQELLDVLAAEPVLDAVGVTELRDAPGISGRDLAFLLSVAQWRKHGSNDDLVQALA